MSLNLTILTGNLGSEPRFLTIPSTGRKKASFSIVIDVSSPTAPSARRFLATKLDGYQRRV